MTPFTIHRGIVATLDRANVDTDQIIPKQFLKSVLRTGFGEHLFCDWRYLSDGTPNPEFELNAPRFRAATILVTRNNFGCGSSREHAVWAIQQYGFRAVIAPSFADIFRNNSTKNGLLTVELAERQVEEIFRQVSQGPSLEATVDLPSQQITLHTRQPMIYPLDIDPSVKDYLVRGVDAIGMTLQHEQAIASFETHHNPQLYRST